MYKITNYMTVQAIRDGIKKGHSIYLKPVNRLIVDVDKETGEETKHPTPDPLPFHRYEITGPFNPQAKIFRCTVGLGPTGQVEQVF